jgi:hypothetical protein
MMPKSSRSPLWAHATHDHPAHARAYTVYVHAMSIQVMRHPYSSLCSFNDTPAELLMFTPWKYVLQRDNCGLRCRCPLYVKCGDTIQICLLSCI